MDSADLAANPLLDLSGLPHFSEIRPEHVQPALEFVLAQNRAARERLLSSGDAYTWDNFVQPLEDMEERLNRVWAPVVHLNSVNNSHALRQAYNDGLPRVSAYRTEIGQDLRSFRIYKHIAGNDKPLRLDQAQQKLLEHTLRDFRLMGAELGGRQKVRFKEVQQEVAQLSSRFADNVLDATQAWEFLVTEEEQLAGLPMSAREMARQAAERDAKQGYRFSLDAPSYLAFMTFADNRELRARMYQAYVTRASEEGPHHGRWDNSEIIVCILRLRREAARLLGFANYAEYSLERKMVDSVEHVLDFLYTLAARAKPVAEREIEALKVFAETEYGHDELAAWDIPYFAEKLRQHHFDFSQEDLRPYFPVDQVITGMFEVVGRLYGITFRQIDGIATWHPDVRFYEIRDGTGALRGQFYLDLYARAHKRGGAWMDECISRKRANGSTQIPVAHLTCNSSPPVGDRPALFTHEEVITLFHEFGHGLHHMLTMVDYVGISGINGVAWDAVELPSQFMENWCWQREVMDLVARHYATGAGIDDGLFTKLVGAKNFQSGMQMVRQLEFALFDMRLHCDDDPDDSKSVQALLDEVRRDVAVVIPPAYNRFQNAFTHIFAGGYAAGYYGYKWAEVLSADAFSKFEDNGVFDRKTGLEFLHNILEQGGTCEPMDLYTRFLGRRPRIDAMLRYSGLAQ